MLEEVRVLVTKKKGRPYWTAYYVHPVTGKQKSQSTGELKRRDAERWAATSMQRARIPAWIGIGTAGVAAVILPIAYDMASIAIFGCGLLASLVFCLRVMGQPTRFRWGIHAANFWGLSAVAFAVHVHDVSPLLNPNHRCKLLWSGGHLHWPSFASLTHNRPQTWWHPT